MRDKDGSTIKHELIKIDKPILRIPMLAIHLQVTHSHCNKPQKHLIRSPHAGRWPLPWEWTVLKLVCVCVCVCAPPQRDIHTAGFKPNLQTNFAPVLATAVKAQLSKAASNGTAPAPAAGSADEGDTKGSAGTSSTSDSTCASKHHPLLMELIAGQLGVTPADIVDFELHVSEGGAHTHTHTHTHTHARAMSACVFTF